MLALLGTLFGYAAARRFFAEPCPWLCLALAPLLGLFTALLSGGLLLQAVPWIPWIGLTGLGFLVGLVALRKLRPPAASFRSPSRWLQLYLALGLGTVLVFCWFHQSVGMVVDGDFFIHGANIGLFSRGYLPPVNPFLGVPMHGHYGRDLAIAICVRDTGMSPLTSEWVLTTVWQALTFLVLSLWLRRELDDDLAGVLGGGFAFFGMNFSAYSGLSELLANNNPAAFCLLVVVGWAVFRAARLGPPVWLAAGLLLGLDALIYENHFGVLGLALLVFWRRPRAMFTMGVVALLTAALLSGVMRSTARGAKESGAEQTIRVRVFKKELFRIRTDNLRPSRAFETRARPWRADFAPSSEYRFLWSQDILDTFWYPVWLLPLSTAFLLWAACRRQSAPVGVWWCLLAWFSYLTPGLADFGFFEPETARWLVVTALGAAVALGLSLATCRRLWPRAGLVLTALLVGLCSVGFQLALRDMVNAYQHPGTPLPVGRPGLPPGQGLFPNPQLALSYHYGISAQVLEAAAWIRAHSKKGENFLCDSWDLPPNARGTLIGASGLLPAMEATPPWWSRSVNSYQTNLQQRGFWATGDLQRLDPSVDWLLVSRSSASFGRPDFQNEGAGVYRVANVPPLPAPGEGPFSLSFDRHSLAGEPLTLLYSGPFRCLFQLRFLPLGEQEFVADENIQSASSRGRMTFIAPYASGEYRTQSRLSSAHGWEDFGTLTVTDKP